MPPKKKLPGLTLAVGPKEEDRPDGMAADKLSIGTDAFSGMGITVDKSGVKLADGDADKGGAAVSFDEIELVKKLGAGCSSVVQLARHKKSGALYALKLINLFDKGVRDMLLQELKALFTADCEALISFHGATYREGQVAVILEFMNLGGLDSVLRKCPGKRIPEPVLAAMAFQMIFGLGYLAYERRVHRDIKLPNILVHTTGQVKLTDFGISRELSTAVLAKTFIGSFAYMSPERVMHQPYDYASDIWSLGLVLLECADGKYPYPESSSQIAMVMTITEGDEPLPPREGGEYTPEFHDFLKLCICKDPKGRATAAELLDDPWFERHGIGSLDDAVENVRVWLNEAGFKDEYVALATAAAAPATGAGSSTATASALEK